MASHAILYLISIFKNFKTFTQTLSKVATPGIDTIAFVWFNIQFIPCQVILQQSKIKVQTMA